MSNSEAVIGCHNLSKTYSDGASDILVLTGIDLVVSKGESVAILGESGSGKSTLMHLLCGLDRPTEGRVVVQGQDITGLTADQIAEVRNRSLGFVYQFHHLLPEFSAVENVAMPLRVRGLSKAKAEERALAVLEELGLANRGSHLPSELSGGERQRCAIARAVVTDPACVLADEPTGNLDARNSALVVRQMLDLNSRHGTALIVVTHDKSVASQMSRQLLMRDGKLVEQ